MHRAVNMASLTLKNIKKVYPFSGDEQKKAKKKKKNEDAPVEKKANLQITDEGVDFLDVLQFDSCHVSRL